MCYVPVSYTHLCDAVRGPRGVKAIGPYAVTKTMASSAVSYTHLAVGHVLKKLVYTAAIITISTFQSGSASFASTVARLGGFWLSTHSSHAWLS